MAILQVRDVPDELYENLSALAKRENRSISQETIVLLKTVLNMKEERISRRKALLDSIENHSIPIDPEDFPEPAELIREDRDR